MNNDKEIQEYLECALWSTCDDEGNPLDDNYDIEDFDEKTKADLIEDLVDFIDSNRHLLEAAGISAGHDFWLTRNGHGAGFWDRGLGKIGETLSDAARVYGSVDLYVGDDGKIYA